MIWNVITLGKEYLGTRRAGQVLIYLPGLFEGWCAKIPDKLVRDIDDDVFTVALKDDFTIYIEKIVIDGDGNYITTNKSSIKAETFRSLFQQ